MLNRPGIEPRQTTLNQKANRGGCGIGKQDAKVAPSIDRVRHKFPNSQKVALLLFWHNLNKWPCFPASKYLSTKEGRPKTAYAANTTSPCPAPPQTRQGRARASRLSQTYWRMLNKYKVLPRFKS